MKLTMQIFVKTLRGKTITLYVSPSDTMGDIKNRLLWKTSLRVHLDHQQLCHDGVALADHSRLKDSNVEHNDALHLVLKPWRGEKSMMQISLKTLADTMITLAVEPADSIENLKDKLRLEGMIENIHYVDIELWDWSRWITLEDGDGRALWDYNIQKDSTLRLVA